MERTPAPDWQTVAGRLRRQLLIERLILAVIALALLGRYGYGYLGASSCVIIADGKRIAMVESKAVANDLLNEVLASATGCSAEDAKFAQQIEMKRQASGTLLDRESALAVLKAKLTVQAEKWAVLIDGRPCAAVDTEEQAGEVLELARQRYGKLAPNILEEPSFKQNVKPQLLRVDLSVWRASPQEAVELLFRPTGGKACVHTVSKGEVASAIAEDYGITLADMKKLNPDRSLDRLRIDDKLKVGVGKVPLTVVVRDQVSRTEMMPPRTESITSVRLYAGKRFLISPGRPGKRRVKLAITYENGVETGREVLEETIDRPPSPKRVAIGIKPRR